MTSEEQTILIIKGAISELSEPHRTTVNQTADMLRGLVENNPGALLAIALVGAEEQQKATQ